MEYMNYVRIYQLRAVTNFPGLAVLILFVAHNFRGFMGQSSSHFRSYIDLRCLLYYRIFGYIGYILNDTFSEVSLSISHAWRFEEKELKRAAGTRGRHRAG